MRRRAYLRAAGATAVGLSTAGCLEFGGSGGASGPLTIATYDSFFGDDGTAGEWLRSAWEDDHDVDVEFVAPDAGVNEYITRKQDGASIDPDLFVGLNTPDLVRVDEELPDTDLFDDLRADLEHADDVKPELEVDPENRAVPYDTGYISLVYDGTEVENPETFDALLEPEYEGALLAQNAQSSDPGLAFLLWTVHEHGPEDYLDYWEGLVENDVRVLDDWQPAYNAFLEGERPVVVSYSTDQVYYNDEDELPHHQVGFLNDQGYANPETVARFADADRPEDAAAFVDFLLTDEAQRNVAVKNVQFPATTTASLPPEYTQYAYEPPEPVTFTYEELAGNVEGWTEAWAQLVASN
ncbi:thiamine ABC transporter substrate-binding protein [Halobacterium yunchengense]|uniref:thiamine ABC transporter substrate-binding protein n=1 Tax=Halobacterium yunchengense TaxID=3108497 RepID=UPI00300A9D39